MDSGNSGSMQSSSGGDEEYDSYVGPFTTQPRPQLQLQPPPPQQLQTHMLVDPLSNYLDPLQRSPSLVNLDMVWYKPGSGRSEPNPADLGGLIPCSSASSTPTPQNQALIFSRQFANRDAPFSTLHQSLPQESASGGLLSVSAATNDQAHNTNSNNNSSNSNNVVRNPKKRSRASRRAPTTVLTTDTTNFRAMVQEFTGIPAPPFTSSAFPRTRLDLFGSAAASAIRSPHFDLPPPPPYLLRPFAQKLQPPSHPFVSLPSSSIPSFPTASSTVDAGTFASNSTNPSTNSTSINYQVSSDLRGLLKQPPQNFLNMNMHSTPIDLNFQSILKYPLENSSTSIPQTADSHLKMSALEEFGLSHANVDGAASGLHNMFSSSTTSSDGALCRAHIIGNPSSNWAEGKDTDNDGDHGLSIERAATNGKVSYPASSSDFRGEKGPERVAPARGEGMVEPWINCSSD
ncbi:hypothetical protein L6164_025139 [Bauhinia variegata]|uniref:Uncharacterized protein n=1 Tax=Bauhinia variegata TaxID=167791 RepID=A0ACB9M271_BAUVA|nr:hypothetical protein L6164_025139 [Bauhinia variegata]